MKAYLSKRIIGAIPLLVLVTFLAFILINLRTSDPAEIALRVNQITPTDEMVQSMREELGLNQPFLVRYKNWIVDSFNGEFGTSYVNNKPVLEELRQAIPPTLQLAAATLAIIVIFSMSIGILCSVFENRWQDRFLRGIVFVLAAMPSFWIGLLLMWYFSVHLGLLPTSGMEGPTSIILPAVTLSLTFLSTYVRLIRNNMVQNKHENFVLYAKVRGLKQSTITWKIFTNSIQSSLTAFGMSVPRLIAGTVVVENIFAWPGIGRLCVKAIFNSDVPVIQAYIFMMAVLFIVCNLIVDILIVLIDPRLRREAK
ncbi:MULTISPECIES: nickel/cobalt ABC transporter permease [unclassified Paenibacillus]|uniref:nickel/cobalt ABC transporter permease n=1 Tax=unclassified Paenibacillus TaxID=185978 RepID=UPI001F4457F5|nr:nickel/cobalt ABC transporter permease [Paenibacillus sp. JJ-223]CAH1198910.1 Metal-staphylopine import system permease protein CntB [Paenibacillus sp. JJ-223]